MKICRFRYADQINSGVLENEKVFLFENHQKTSQSFDLSEIKLLPPTVPTKIICVGRNYAEHAAELGNEVPKEPLLFLKPPSSVITDGDAIQLPPQSEQVEHEGELGIIIEKNCKNLSEEDNPFDYVRGYVCLNDITARDLQRRDVQFTRAKSFDTFCPISLFIETEVDVSNVSVVTKVNGMIKQSGRTSQMVFSVEFLIRYISQQMTLAAGDIIATGTPSGVSRLNSGDVCEVEIEGIGKLTNSVESAAK